MPGMMRSIRAGWKIDRASQTRDWQRLERAQLAPWLPLEGEVRPPRFLPMEPDDVQYGYWSVVLDLDWYLNEQARPYLSSALTGAADG